MRTGLMVAGVAAALLAVPPPDPLFGLSLREMTACSSLTRAATRSSDRFATHFGQAGSQPESPHPSGSPLPRSGPADRSVSFRRETIPPALTLPGPLAH